jgi:tetratricopeptide (TPR) repeat protein
MLRQRRTADALAVLRRVPELQPESAVAHLNVGIALADSSLKEEALAEFEEALRLNPQLPEAHYNRGRALYEGRRYEEARASLERAISLRPDYAPALMMLGMTEGNLGRPEKAVELLERSLALGWSDTAAHYKLGRALLDIGREDDGVEHLRKAVELDPANSQALFALMRAMASRNPAEAKKYGQQVREAKADSLAGARARALSNFALGAARDEDWPKAIEQLREAIEVCGDCSVRALLHKNLGLILAQSSNNAGAVAELSVAHELDPNDRDIAYALELLRKRVPDSGR